MMKEKKGFTLAEMMIVIIISVIIIGALYSVSSVCRGSLQTGQAYLDLQRQVSTGIDRMLRELYQAGGQIRVDVPDQSLGNMLSFQVPTVCLEAGCGNTGTIYTDNRTINWGDGLSAGHKIRYLVPNEGGAIDGSLIRRVLDESDNELSNTILANEITNITFTGFDLDGNEDDAQPNSVTISLTAQKTTTEGRLLQTDLNSQVTLRNN